MALHTSEAILLDVYDLHEYDQIVTMLTRDFGKRRGVTRGSRRRFSRFSGQLTPLTTVRATWFEKDGRDLDRVSSLETTRSADSLTRELEGILVTAYLAEHVAEFAQEGEEDDRMYRLLDSTITALLDGVDIALAARYFEAWVLRLSGVFPEPTLCPSCGRELSSAGAVLAASREAILCADCGRGGNKISSEVLAFFNRIGRTSLRDLAKNAPDQTILAKCETINGHVRRAFLQQELKSYRVMRETLASLPATRR